MENVNSHLAGYVFKHVNSKCIFVFTCIILDTIQDYAAKLFKDIGNVKTLIPT